MPKIEISKETKSRMDRELRQYWENKKQLKELELEIIESSNSAEGQPRSNSISDTTQKKALRLVSTRTIIFLKRRITYVENTIKKLKPYEKEIFNLIFKENCDVNYCKTMKNIDKSTYYHVYNKSIKILAEEWGEI